MSMEEEEVLVCFRDRHGKVTCESALDIDDVGLSSVKEVFVLKRESGDKYSTVTHIYGDDLEVFSKDFLKKLISDAAGLRR